MFELSAVKTTKCSSRVPLSESSKLGSLNFAICERSQFRFLSVRKAKPPHELSRKSHLI